MHANDVLDVLCSRPNTFLMHMNDMFDEALERLRGMGGEVEGGGDPNHGPMAAEALVALGRAELAPRWADEYRRRLAPLPSPRSPVTQDIAGTSNDRSALDW